MKRHIKEENVDVDTLPPKSKQRKRAKPSKTSTKPELPPSTLSKATAIASKQVEARVDEACPVKDFFHVYVDDSNTVFDASLSLSSIEGNNNKFYYIQLLTSNDDSSNHAVWTHWGRVGENGQSKLEKSLTVEAAKIIFSKKFKDKTGLSWEKRKDAPKANKYMLIEKSYEDAKEEYDDNLQEAEMVTRVDEPPCTLSTELQDLVNFLFNAESLQNAMASQKYNFNKLPLGKLSKGTLEKGYLALKDLGEVVQDPSLARKHSHGSLTAVLSDLSSNYYTIIPHDFGRQRPTPITNETQLQAELDLIESLGNMQIANEILKKTGSPTEQKSSMTHPLDDRMAALGLQEAIPLDHDSAEFKHLAGYFLHSKDSHSITADTTIKHIYRISRTEEIGRFTAGGYDRTGMKRKTVKDRRALLWHGSRGCNFGGILSQGLRIAPPEAPANGKAFGKGVYLADRSSKSAAYCDPWTSDRTGLLLLCEAQLGDPPYTRADHEYNAVDTMREKRCISVKMHTHPSNDPAEWLDAVTVNENLKGALMPDPTVPLPAPNGFPNEYIVYDIAQVKIRYVFMLKWKTSQQWGIF
ncbi:MAG: hypothetical protein Q9191_007244 [Dirinaria sp. TL-2023a]